MRPSDNIQTTYMKHPSLVEADIFGARLIYMPLNDDFLALNLSAQLVWILLDRQGAFDTGARTSAKIIYADWFDPMPLDDTIENDVEAAIQSFIDDGLLIPKPKKLALYYYSCPLHESKSKRTYSSPHITKYDSRWMRDNHPKAFHTLGYSDRWGPSE